MPRIELPSEQADGKPNFVDLKEPDEFMASDLFAIHRAVRVKSSATGETEYSAQEWADDRVERVPWLGHHGLVVPVADPGADKRSRGGRGDRQDDEGKGLGRFAEGSSAADRRAGRA